MNQLATQCYTNEFEDINVFVLLFSAVVDISGRMGVSSHYIDTGIYVKSSMFTSQMIKGAIAYKEGKLVKLNIDAPEKPVEVFHVS